MVLGERDAEDEPDDEEPEEPLDEDEPDEPVDELDEEREEPEPEPEPDEEPDEEPDDDLEEDDLDLVRERLVLSASLRLSGSLFDFDLDFSVESSLRCLDIFSGCLLLSERALLLSDGLSEKRLELIRLLSS